MGENFKFTPNKNFEKEMTKEIYRRAGKDVRVGNTLAETERHLKKWLKDAGLPADQRFVKATAKEIHEKGQQ